MALAMAGLMLGGCGNSTVVGAGMRPGAERQVAASSQLPSAARQPQYDAAVVPVDETRDGPKIGSLVAGKGGQKAQLEALAKVAAKRDAEAREAREARDREQREAEAKRPKKTKAVETAAAKTPAAKTAEPAAPPACLR